MAITKRSNSTPLGESSRSQEVGAHGPVLGLIPARRGSKGIPNKNLSLLAGKPLVLHTIDTAMKCESLDRIVLSTDDPRIADIGRTAGIMVPFIRPPELATDTTPMVSVVEHAVKWMAEQAGVRTGAVMVLQPTSPLRQAWHIDEAVAEFRRGNPDGVMSVCEVKEHPYELMSFVGEEIRLAFDRPKTFSRRQDFPEFYYVNGAIYLVRTATFLRDHTLFPERCIPYVMDRRYSLDIDSPLDLHIAECTMSWALND